MSSQIDPTLELDGARRCEKQPPAETRLLDVRDLSVHFGRRAERVRAIEGLSYRLRPGSTLAIIGESGAGKSLSCRALMGLLPRGAVVEGSARLNGKELIGLSEREMRRHRGADIAMVFQDAAQALNPTMRVGHQIAEAIRVRYAVDRRAADDQAMELLERLGLPAVRRRFLAYPHQLSGGMQQRVMIAIAIAARPRILIADETTRSSDAINQRQIVELLTESQRVFGMSLLFISHDLGLAASLADEVLVMRAGRTVEHEPTDKLLRCARMPYTQALLSTMPQRAKPCEPAPRRPPRARDDDSLLEVRDLVHEFRVREPGRLRTGVLRAVDDVSFELKRGETLGLVGASGAGKSTIVRALLQLDRPKSGSVLLEGTDLTHLSERHLREHRRRMQVVFQHPFGSLDPTWRVSRLVEEPLLGYGIGDHSARRRRVEEVLDLVGLPSATYGRRRPRELSGGQCQRVALARALAPDPSLVILDEATSSLDAIIQAKILALLAALRSQLGLTYLFISHDLAAVARISDRVAVLHAGQICEIAPTEILFRAPAHPYTAALIGAMRCLHRREADTQLAHASFDKQNHATRSAAGGCSFRDSCSRFRELCSSERPRLRAVRPGHMIACHFPALPDSLGTKGPNRPYHGG